MSTTIAKLNANRANAKKTSGPVTAEGKAIVGKNATKHGIFSQQLFLESEDPDDFRALTLDLHRSLNPVGTVELALVERIAINMWRQRRLVTAETASLTLSRTNSKVADGVSSELGRSYGEDRVNEGDLTPFDPDQEHWCQTVLDEIETLEEIDLKKLEDFAPHVFAQLKSDSEEEDQDPQSYIEDHSGGLTGYIAELLLWCRRQLSEAKRRPHILALADQVRSSRLVLDPSALELFARYQTTLDNQLFKTLKALRDAQEWRLKTLEDTTPAPTGMEDVAA